MLSNTTALTPKPAGLPPAAPQPAMPALSGTAASAGPTFAQILNIQPDLPPPAEHTDPVPTRPDAADEPATDRSATSATAMAARRAQANAAQPKPAAPAQSRAPEAAKPADEAKVSDDNDDATVAVDATQDTAMATAGLAEFTQLIGLAVPAPQLAHDADAAIHGLQAARTGRVVDEERPPMDRDGNATADDQARERRPVDAPAARAAETPRAKSVDLAAAAADKTATRSAGNDALQATSSNGSGAGPSTPQAGEAPTLSFAAVLGQALPVAAPTAAPVGANGQVQAPVHSSAFAPELGAQVSLLAVDGVQQAELQLNPADMGPVSVQIVVDGSQAHVSFHAAEAETRQALEQSLPDLAAALQGQGLTLSGGGVFQQAAKGEDKRGDAESRSADGADRRAGRSDGDGVATRGAAPARRSVGLLDTFA
ncbi:MULTISPECIES: flagellar hook-length control protein FliK [unclassified Roseateles]|uniref:flagellar hook-length control protein FliK n=1 Tax=unclassified Roseateles TaxID=2626991 RepID=UPI0006FC6E9D|nr:MULTISPECIES: flagellar hook-length control protein FliK [unclassified Roseateles]KQW51860.1 hypothetical protein ASC81_04430 [Pelomonas sp. Root405]KRA78093.1 hypothetical protein ASD88_04435 [Pelomonas sp. Root662]